LHSGEIAPNCAFRCTPIKLEMPLSASTGAFVFSFPPSFFAEVVDDSGAEAEVVLVVVGAVGEQGQEVIGFGGGARQSGASG